MSNLCCRLCTLCCNEDNISDANLQVDNQHDEVVNILHAGANGCTKHYRHGEYVTVDAFNATILGLLHASPTWNDIVLNKDRMARLSGDVPYQSIVKISVPHPEPDKRYVGTGFVFRGFGNDTNLYVITNAHVFQGGEITGSVIFNYDSDTAEKDERNIIREVFSSPITVDGVSDEEHLDFLVIQIQSYETDNFEEYVIEETERIEMFSQRPAFIISHPHGWPKQLSHGFYDAHGSYFVHNILTCEGSSGAPMFQLPIPHGTDGRWPVALHFFGGRAIRFNLIMKAIRYVLEVRK